MAFWNVFFEEGNINSVISRPKLGKTNLIVDMGYRAIEYGFTVYSNIIFFKPWNVERAIKKGWLSDKIDYKEIPKKFIYTALASDLILKSTSTEDNIVIIDEAGITASTYKALSNTSVQMRYLGYNIRKIGGCLIIIAQTKRSVVPDLREELINYEIRVKRDKYDVRSFEVLKRHESYNSNKREYDIDFLPYDNLDEVPLSKIPYDTKSTSGFIWDINLPDIYYEIIVKGYDAFESRENMPDIVRQLVADKKIEDHMRKKKFMRTGTVADLLKVSDTTIRSLADKDILKCITTDKGQRLFSRDEVRKYAIKKGIL